MVSPSRQCQGGWHRSVYSIRFCIAVDALVPNGALLSQPGTTTVHGMTALERITEAPAVPDGALIDKRNGKPKRVPRKVRHAIRLILTGEVTSIKAAAERADLSREHLSRCLGMPHIRVFASSESQKTIAAGTLRASARLLELIDANSEHVSAQVSERILTSEGILKSDQRAIAVNVDVRAGFVLDLREEQPSVTPGMRTIDANPLTDQGQRSPDAGPDDE